MHTQDIDGLHPDHVLYTRIVQLTFTEFAMPQDAVTRSITAHLG